MKHLVSLDGLIGKTIIKTDFVDLDEFVFLRADDESFIFLRAKDTYGDAELSVVTDLSEVSDLTLVNVGIISETERQESINAGKEARIQAIKKRDLDELDRLKSLYESTSK